MRGVLGAALSSLSQMITRLSSCGDLEDKRNNIPRLTQFQFAYFFTLTSLSEMSTMSATWLMTLEPKIASSQSERAIILH